MATASTTTTPPRSTATGVTPTAHRQPRTARARRTRSAPPPAWRSASHAGEGCTVAGWLDGLCGDVTGARLLCLRRLAQQPHARVSHSPPASHEKSPRKASTSPASRGSWSPHRGGSWASEGRRGCTARRRGTARGRLCHQARSSQFNERKRSYYSTLSVSSIDERDQLMKMKIQKLLSSG